ncbi:hypothetical protein DACRYDRAFT_23709 [Dacryopinax primogenitus]|uniref:FUN34 transmembrane protein n=1 Tax=Dacryopinax primogenitus (strain DJM 731) TaxID=1858805 RepID=M5FRB1_DACPD|nr:uncharacterized protein DACRYDRAFT_23709 [Dacryopinax primogenitus]EJT99640.1 hypothetical protein DACRYDRAFT_23709 [Dacryopinax primogenitus]
MSPSLESKHENGSLHEHDGRPPLERQLTLSMPAFPQYHRKFGNPAPLGVLSFAGPTFVLSMFNVQVRDVAVSNVVVGMALMVGGLTQLLSGMWEFACGNTFGGTVFSLFSGFWLSFGLIYIPSSGILGAYTDNPADAAQLHNALGVYLTSWFILIFIMIFATFRSSIVLAGLIILVDLVILVLAVAQFTQNPQVTLAGGYLGLLAAFGAFYVGAATLYTKDVSLFTLPTGELPKEKV